MSCARRSTLSSASPISSRPAPSATATNIRNMEVSLVLNALGEIELCVADTGIGIAPEDQAQLFDRVGHGRPDITSAERGTGLGLPIVKGLVDIHGGRVTLESALGQGTRMTVIFPAQSTIRSGELLVA